LCIRVQRKADLASNANTTLSGVCGDIDVKRALVPVSRAVAAAVTVAAAVAVAVAVAA
jgi:hypothetical protein